MKPTTWIGITLLIAIIAGIVGYYIGTATAPTPPPPKYTPPEK